MQLVQQGNVNKLLMPVVMATPGKAMSVLEKSRDWEITAAAARTALALLVGVQGMEMSQQHSRAMATALRSAPAPCQGWAEVGEVVQQARSRRYHQGLGKAFPPAAP